MELDRSSTRTITTSLRAAVPLAVTDPLEKPSIRINSRGTCTVAATATVRRLFVLSSAATIHGLPLQFESFRL